MSAHIDSVFEQEGILAAEISGYKLRPQQVDFARRIAETIEAQSVLIAEAGTGTGKTFAYLIAAILSGGKTIVSTGTKTLQDQLFKKDIPTIKQALRIPLKTTLLKGRANYVCHYYLEQKLKDGYFRHREDAAYIRLIQRFSQESRTGDKAECTDVPEDSSLWQEVTSSRENCLGQECPHNKECFLLAARKEAMSADLIVVNHHLFFADVMLRDGGMGELLPACNTVIFDEAHQVPEIAGVFFSENVSTGQLVDLARDIRTEGLAAAADCRDLQDIAAKMEKGAKDLRLSVGVGVGRFPALQLESNSTFLDELQKLQKEMAEAIKVLESQSERSEGLDRCWQRAAELQYILQRWQESKSLSGFVRWVEAYTHSLQFNMTPLNIAEDFQKQMAGHPRAWIFTSATLSVQGDFSHYAAALGLDESNSACWESPFDYESQGMLYVPKNLPIPSAVDFTESVVKAAWPVIQATQGGAFFLCTSLRAMRRIHELLTDLISQAQLDIPLFLQGEHSKNELLRRFRKLDKSILVGSQSFWEGVDVRGQALSLVVIDKLPFMPPDDPVLSARIEEASRQGKNAFMTCQVPHAIISMKQGAGRLIRDEMDRGVLMICDLRLVNKSYGKRIWRSLPPMKRTREIEEVLHFFENIA